METNLILTVALAAATIVVVLVLVAVIIYQRWRLGDKNAAISKFINENEQLRQNIVILVLIARNTILSNRIEDAHIENDRLRRENKSLEKENDELFNKLDKMEVGT